MQLCRGPLPAGHPQAGVTYFSVDHDVAAGACNLRVTPPIESLRHASGPCVLLDAHRAPNEWYAIALQMPHLIIQGDPAAIRPRGCSTFAAELEALAAPVRLMPELRCVARLADAMPLGVGKHVVLAGTHEAADQVYRHLRPDGVQPGDVVQDFHGRSYVANDINSATHIFVDNGRRALRRTCLWQHLVVSPSQIRAGEYDTVVVLPGVAPSLGRAVCARCRYMVIAVAHSPRGYITGSV